MPDLLAINGLRAGYGEAVVLSGMTLSLAEGQVLALLGRNGTGKTTLINSIVGVTRRFSGTVRLGGRDVTVLLIEHDMDLVFSFADRISVLVNGAMLVEGPPGEVARDPQVKAVYLGEAADV